MDRNLSEPGGGGDNPVKQSLTGKKPKKQRGRESSSLEVEPTTKRVKDLLKKIDLDLKELTEDELSSFMRSLGHRNTRKRTKTERDAYKSTVEETNKYLKEMLGMQKFYKAQMEKFQSETKEMEAKCEKLQKEMEGLRKTIADYQMPLDGFSTQYPGLQKMIADNQMLQATGMSPHVINNLVQVPPQAWGPIANSALDAAAAAYTPPVMNPGSGEFGGIQQMREPGLENYHTSTAALPSIDDDFAFWLQYA